MKKKLNPFVRTPEEIALIEEVAKFGKYYYSGLEVQFETTPEFARDVLPKCYEPLERPTCSVYVFKYQTVAGEEFGCSSIYVNCRYKDIEGPCVIAIYLDEEKQTILGREVWGEGKKQARMDCYRLGNESFGFVERHGKKIIEIYGDTSTPITPQQFQMKSFEIKASPSAIGSGFEYNPKILTMEADVTIIRGDEGVGKVKFESTDMDPLAEIPVIKTIGAQYTEVYSEWWISKVDEMEDSDAYLPYYYGQKHDNYLKMKPQFGLTPLKK